MRAVPLTLSANQKVAEETECTNDDYQICAQGTG